MKKSGEGRAITPFRWAPALMGLSSAAALAVAVQARTTVPAVVPEVAPQLPIVELMGPPAPEPSPIFGPPITAEVLARRSTSPMVGGPPQTPSTGGLPGRIGPIGPITGPLNAQVPEGAPIFGPTWDRKPLPRLPNSGQFIGPLVAATPAANPTKPPLPGASPAGTGDADSELPDASKLALSRAANPTVEVRDRTVAKAEATPERPVVLNVMLGEGGTRTAGDAVVVRLTANVDCYFVVMRVDPAGKAATVYQSSRPAQRVACVVKAGPEPGAEYLVTIASARALNSEDVTAALKGAGNGFTTMPAGAEGGSQPGQAWSTVLTHAGSVGGSAPPTRWQRHEWAVATTTFATVAKPEKPAEPEVKAAAKPLPGKTVAAKTPTARVLAGKPLSIRKPADTGEGSALPSSKPAAAAAPEKGTEKPVDPQKGESLLPGGSSSPGGE